MAAPETFPTLSTTERLARLTPPPEHGRLSFVLDTDPSNEIDDQFAITYALLSPERLECKAIHAAPFSWGPRGDDPQGGMEMSYKTAKEVLDRLQLPPSTPPPPVVRGSTRFATDRRDLSGFTGGPVESEATANLIRLARQQPDDQPLYVVAIAPITNVASAILLAPDIIRKIVVVWLGGQPHNYGYANECNLRQDVYASRVVLDCGVPLVLTPCNGMAEQLLLTAEDVRTRLAGRGEIGAYLADAFLGLCRKNDTDSRWMWDMVPIAWLINPWLVETIVIPTPILATSPFRTEGYCAPHLGRKVAPLSHFPAHCTWGLDPHRHFMREGLFVRRDPIFRDFFRKLESHASGGAG